MLGLVAYNTLNHLKVSKYIMCYTKHSFSTLLIRFFQLLDLLYTGPKVDLISGVHCNTPTRSENTFQLVSCLSALNIK